MTRADNTEADRIKARLRDCKTVAEVEAVADEEREKVKDIATRDRALAIQISNLKAYVLDQLPDPKP